MAEEILPKKKFLITLQGEQLEILAWLKTQRGLEPSAAVSFVLGEWYEMRSGNIARTGRPLGSVVKAEEIPDVNLEEEQAVPPVAREPVTKD